MSTRPPTSKKPRPTAPKKPARKAPKLAPGDYVFLAFLTWAPMSAYDIKKFMAESVSNFWSAAHSQVYQQAKRLVRDGYVKERPIQGNRRKRELYLTPKGRRAVLHWLKQPAVPPQFYAESMVKLFFAAQAGDLSATKRIVEGERETSAGALKGFRELMKVLQADPDAKYPAMTLDLGIRLHRTMVDWAEDTLDALELELAPPPEDARGPGPPAVG